MNMNKASRFAAAINSQANPFQLKAYFFHSTPVLERRKRNNWDNASSFRSSQKKFNQYSKRLKKQSLLRNVNDFTEHLFQSWDSVRDAYDQPSSQKHSWYRPNFSGDGSKKGKSKNKKSQAGCRYYEFCDVDDDIEFENIFRSAFGGGNRSSYWFFIDDDDEPGFRSSSRHSSYYRTYGGRRYQYDEEEDWSSESEKPPVKANSSDRLALGLSASGPLSVEDVKDAYRACALKWHPDRHQGSSKVAAEEKFKVCSAAYQSLCDKLAIS